MKRYSTKLMALFLASAVIAGTVPATTIAALASDRTVAAQTVEAKEDIKASDGEIQELPGKAPESFDKASPDEEKVFSFIPTQSGVYVLNVLGDGALKLTVTATDMETGETDEVTAIDELDDWNDQYAESSKLIFDGLEPAMTYEIHVISDEQDDEENPVDVNFKLWFTQAEISNDIGSGLKWNLEKITDEAGVQDLEGEDGENPDEGEDSGDADAKLRLNITGNGTMNDFGYHFDKAAQKDIYYAVPWTDEVIQEKEEGTVTAVRVADGVKSIGDGAFSGLFDLEEMSLPSTLERIGGNTALTSDLKAITFGGTQAQWDAIDINRNSSYYNDPVITFSDKSTRHFYEGSCGENLTWKVERNEVSDADADITGTLVISGTGAMKNYSKENPAPWINAYCNDVVNEVQIDKGVTTIGDYAFAGMEYSNLEREGEDCRFVIPEGVTAIGDNAFRGVSFGGNICLILPSTLKSIGKQMFFNGSLARVAFEGTQDQFKKVSIGMSNSELRGDENLIECSDGTYEIPMEKTLKMGKDTSNTISSQDTDFTYLLKVSKSAVYNLNAIYHGAVDTNVDVDVYNADENSDEETFEFEHEKGKSNTFSQKAFLTGGQTYVVEFNYGEDDDAFELGQDDDDVYCDLKIVQDKTAMTYFKDAVKLGTKSYTYDGKEKKPTVSVKGLTSGTDYTVEYKNNKNAGTASVVLKGKGNYTGSITKNFTIKKASQALKVSAAKDEITAGSDTKLSVSGAKGTLSYKTSNKRVAIVSGGKIKGVGAGTAKITVTSAGGKNYINASKTVTVKVNPSKTVLSKVTSPKAGQLKIEWKKNTTGDGYQIQYATASSFKGAKTLNVSKEATVSQLVTGLKRGTKYYVRVRTVDKSKKLASGWSAVKSVKVKK